MSLVAAVAVITAALAWNREPAPEGRRPVRVPSVEPLHFEANRGQADPGVLYVANGAGFEVRLEAFATSIALPSGALRLTLVDAARSPRVTAEEELPGKANFVRRGEWVRGVPGYRRIRYGDVYPGIDLIFFGGQQGIDYLFEVRPGGDPAAIRVAIAGAERLELNASGELLAHIGGRLASQDRPTLYQEADGTRTPVGGAYRLAGAREVGFDVTAYDRQRPLLIDLALTFAELTGRRLAASQWKY
jgi:hypothetical protein